MFGFKKIAMPTAAQALPGPRHTRSAPRKSISSITTR